MNTERISVIVPVYKVEPYLDRCITSIVQQTYSDLEIILVDDGSPDGCPAICDRWAEKDDRIQVIHKENGGVSSARNAGLEVATGQLVMFVDSDDFLSEDAVTCLAELYTKYRAQLVSGSYRLLKIANRHIDYVHSGEKCLSGQEFFDHAPSVFTELLHGAWAKLYETQVIREHSLRFPEGVRFGEDFSFLLSYLACIRSVAYTPKIIYFYEYRNATNATKQYNINISTDCAHMLNEVKTFFLVCQEKKSPEVPVETFAQFIAGKENEYFADVLEHHIEHEKDPELLAKRLEETAALIPDAAKNSQYHCLIQEKQWIALVSQWKRDHWKRYSYRKLRGAFHKVRNLIRNHG